MNYFDILLAKKLNGGGGGDITVESLSVTENGTYTAPSGKAYTPVTVEVAPPEDSYQLKSITTPTSLATFEASAMPMPTLKVSVEAQQDLHGYDKPWVGGAGKNKVSLPTLQGLWLTADGSFSSRTTWVATDKFDAKPNTTYTMSASRETRTSVVLYYDNNDTLLGYDSNDVYGRVALTFTTPSDCSTIAIDIADKVNGQGIAPTDVTDLQLELGSTATTYEPYSNICPISGWSEANVENHGENLFESATFTQGTISGSGAPQDSNTRIRTSSFILVPSGTYKIKSSPELYGTIRVYSSNSYTSYVSGESLTSWTLLNGYEFTLTSDRYMIIVLSKSGTEQIDIVPSDVDKIVVSSTIDTTTISLPQTVYGGKLDVVNGTSGNKVTHDIVDLGDLTWSYVNNIFYATLPTDSYNYITDTWSICSCYNYVGTAFSGTSDMQNKDDGSYALYYNPNYPTSRVIYVKDARYTDVTTFTTAIAGQTFVYELATPTTLATQPTPIKSLNGTNNLSVDCGEILEGEYFKALGGA